jgi:LCP family protein required for cell wall assembly
MSELLNTKINYYVRVDFDGFADIIDELGGIEIEVENTFDDYSYPAAGQQDNPDYYARYEHLHFDSGRQTMNGTTALKYARSRHAYGIEGSDFARAKRQQLVLEAVKNKLLSSSTLLNPVTVAKLVNKFSQNISTNLEIWEMLKLWDLTKDIDRSKMQNKVLSDAPDNYLISSTGEDGAYILVPRSGSFSSIKEMVTNIFATSITGEDSSLETEEEPKKIERISDDASLAIFNGTWVSGLAGRKAATAKESGFKILKTANAPERNYNQTIVYDLTDGDKNSELKILKKITKAEEYSSWPDWVEEYKNASSAPNFILILGTDAEEQY